MAHDRNRIPGLTLTCVSGPQCSVYFEPWGTEYILLSGDVFRVETPALSTGDVEVSYVEGGIVLTFTVDVPIVVTDGTGKRLEI
jgi:hypothetical protein